MTVPTSTAIGLITFFSCPLFKFHSSLSLSLFFHSSLELMSLIPKPASYQPSHYCQCGQHFPGSLYLLSSEFWSFLTFSPSVPLSDLPHNHSLWTCLSSSLHHSCSGLYHLIPHLTQCSKWFPSSLTSPYSTLFFLQPPLFGNAINEPYILSPPSSRTLPSHLCHSLLMGAWIAFPVVRIC